MTVHSILYSPPRYYLKGLTLTQPALAEAWACSYDKRYPYDVMWANSSPNRPGQRLGRAYYRCIGRYELLELSQTRQLWLGQACNSKKPSILSLGIKVIHFTKFQTKSEQKLKKTVKSWCAQNLSNGWVISSNPAGGSNSLWETAQSMKLISWIYIAQKCKVYLALHVWCSGLGSRLSNSAVPSRVRVNSRILFALSINRGIDDYYNCSTRCT